MQRYQETIEREQYLYENIKLLKEINQRLELLRREKEKLTNEIISALDNMNAGNKTYEYMSWQIEVKKPVIYVLNKKLYESIKNELPKKFNPIKEYTSYTIDKHLCDKYITEAPCVIREVLSQMIETKPGKQKVIIKEAV